MPRTAASWSALNLIGVVGTIWERMVPAAHYGRIRPHLGSGPVRVQTGQSEYVRTISAYLRKSGAIADVAALRICAKSRHFCIVFGGAHLRWILKSYADYYNAVRTHRSLHKDAFVVRSDICRRALLRWAQIALKPASKTLGLHRVFIRGEGLKYVIADSTFKRMQVDARAC
jgi:hypothetical protein